MSRKPARCRLNARLGFNVRDWHFELDGLDDDGHEDRMLPRHKHQKIWRRKLRRESPKHQSVSIDATRLSS
jgi:hypothetical protein